VGFEFSGIGQKPSQTLGSPKNESQIHQLSPTKSHTPRPLQMKSNIKTDIDTTVAKIVGGTICSSPVKVLMIDKSQNDTSPLDTNTEEIKQMLASEPKLYQSENTESNPETSETAVIKLAQKYNIELPLILAVIEIESRFKPDNVSSAGAVGLMQLMPVTARELGLRVPMYKNPLKPQSNPRLDERFDPRKNIEAGMKFLSSMINKYNKNYVLALCAYNAGPGRVDKKVPKIRETEKHVGRVLNRYYEYQNSPQEMRQALERLNAILGG
jgi:soluble lytic murein transglycosylase-like protein